MIKSKTGSYARTASAARASFSHPTRISSVIPGRSSGAVTCGRFIGRVPVFLQSLLQAGYSALVNVHREGRKEFLAGQCRQPLSVMDMCE